MKQRLNMKWKKRIGEAGNALVEAALTISLFLTILFSLFDFGFDLWQYQTIVANARNAIRYGAANPTDTTGIQNMFLYDQTTAGTNPLFGLSASNVTVTRTGLLTRDDRLTLAVTGITFTRITMAWAGKQNGLGVTVGIPVEN
jgi:hypothetical protein